MPDHHPPVSGNLLGIFFMIVAMLAGVVTSLIVKECLRSR